MTQLFTNNAATATVGAITNVATSITVADGSKFPAPVAPDFALLTLVGLDGNGNENAWEVVKLTERAANVLTVVRGQEGTAAAAWADATRIELRLTAAGMSAKLDADLSTLTDAGALDGTETLPVNKTGAKRTTVQKILDWIKTQAITWAAKQTISGDLEFSGNARRILGDFSNASLTSRTVFQTNTANAATNIHAVPNGTARQSGFKAESDPVMASGVVGAIDVLDSEVRITSGIRGDFSYQPLTFLAGAFERMRITPDGLMGVLTSNPKNALHVAGDVTLGVTHNATLFWNAYYSGGFKYAGNGYGGLIVLTGSGEMNFAVAANNTGGADVVMTPATVITIKPDRRVVLGEYNTVGALALGRTDTTQEGGQLEFCRSQDNWVAWTIDCYGTGTSPDLRVIGGAGGDVVPLRLKSNGNVQHANFTHLGESSPAIKVKKLTGTTGATEGSSVGIAHGLNVSKIIGVQVAVSDVNGSKFAPGDMIIAGYQFGTYTDPTNVVVYLHGTNSENLLSKPITVTITYEE